MSGIPLASQMSSEIEAVVEPKIEVEGSSEPPAKRRKTMDAEVQPDVLHDYASKELHRKLSESISALCDKGVRHFGVVRELQKKHAEKKTEDPTCKRELSEIALLNLETFSGMQQYTNIMEGYMKDIISVIAPLASKIPTNVLLTVLDDYVAMMKEFITTQNLIDQALAVENHLSSGSTTSSENSKEKKDGTAQTEKQASILPESAPEFQQQDIKHEVDED